MFAVELKFEVQARAAVDARTDAVTSLVGALIRNGNLVDGYVAAGKSKAWTVHGIAPGRDAFHKANWNKFVQQRIAGLAHVNLKSPRVRFMGKILETAPGCLCVTPTGFYLFTTFLDLEPPLRCIRCNGTVPLYRLSSSRTGEHSGLLSWQSHYQARAVDDCWLYPGFCVRQVKG
jgi:predicted  nucleic acid-binding Zn ribbon protein